MEQKKAGTLDSDIGCGAAIVNYGSVRKFEKTKFYQAAIAAQEYLSKNEEKVKGWLNLVVIKEFLTVRAEIDLNYIDLHPSNIEALGWLIDQPLIINLEIDEARLLNSINESELDQMTFAELNKRSAIRFTAINAGHQKSFGCQDTMIRVFKNFIENSLYVDCDEESKDDGLPNPLASIDKKKHSQGFWKKLFSSGKEEKVDDEQLAKLVEMGYDVKQSKKYLVAAKNDLDKALDMFRQEEITGVSQAEYTTIKTGTSSNLDYTANPLIKMMLFITSELENSIKRCHICGKELDAPSLKPRACDSAVCEYIFEESLTGSVLSELKHFPNESLFDLSIAGKSMLSARSGQIFEPFPSFYLFKNEIRDKRGNLDEIKKR